MTGTWEPSRGPGPAPQAPPGPRERVTDAAMASAVVGGWLLIGLVPATFCAWLFIADAGSAQPLLDSVTSAPAVGSVTDIYINRSTRIVWISFTTKDQREITARLLYGTDGLKAGQTVAVRYSLADPQLVQDEPVALRVRSLLHGDAEVVAAWSVWGVGWLAFPFLRRRLRRRWARQDADQDQLLA